VQRVPITGGAGFIGSRPSAIVTGEDRAGDGPQHRYADVSVARDLLRYEARTQVDDGIRALAERLEGQAAEERVEHEAAELGSWGLTP
jgi:nucleoside-diphosphate-sugar epimerase